MKTARFLMAKTICCGIVLAMIIPAAAVEAGERDAAAVQTEPADIEEPIYVYEGYNVFSDRYTEEEDPNAEDPRESEKIEEALLARANRIDDVLCTFYYAGGCGKSPGDPDYGVTASGRPAIAYHTVAVDPRVIPLGSQVMVDYGDGEIHYYFADDTGGLIKGKRLDVCLETEDECIQAGVKHVTVWWLYEE